MCPEREKDGSFFFRHPPRAVTARLGRFLQENELAALSRVAPRVEACLLPREWRERKPCSPHQARSAGFEWRAVDIDGEEGARLRLEPAFQAAPSRADKRPLVREGTRAKACSPALGHVLVMSFDNSAARKSNTGRLSCRDPFDLKMSSARIPSRRTGPNRSACFLVFAFFPFFQVPAGPNEKYSDRSHNRHGKESRMNEAAHHGGRLAAPAPKVPPRNPVGLSSATRAAGLPRG